MNDVLFFILIPVIALYLIFISITTMEKLKLPETDKEKKLFIKSIFSIFVLSLIITVVSNLILSFPEKCWELDFLRRFAFVSIIFSFMIYLIVYGKKNKELDKWILGTLFVFLIAFISFIIIMQPIIDECNKTEPLTLEQLIKENVVGKVYIQNNTVFGENSRNVTVIIDNNNTSRGFNDIFIDIYFPNNCTINDNKFIIKYNKTIIDYYSDNGSFESKFKEDGEGYNYSKIKWLYIKSDDTMAVCFITIINETLYETVKHCIYPEVRISVTADFIPVTNIETKYGEFDNLPK